MALDLVSALGSVAVASRAALGLGGAALLNVGQEAQTVASGDDSRVVGIPAYVADYVKTSRQHDIRDYSGVDLTGETDSTIAFQAAVTAASDGYPLRMVPGEVRLTSPINCGTSFSIEGPRYPAGYDPMGSAWLNFDHLGKGLIPSPDGTSGSIQRMGFRRTQPAVVSGSAWIPAAADWDIEAVGSDVILSELMFLCSTKGFRLAGNGRLTARDIRGHFFSEVFEVQCATDRCYIDTIHAWPFWSQSPEVRTYMEANLISFTSRRNDNPIMDNLFSIWHKVGFRFGYWAGAENLPAGTTSRLSATGCNFDAGAESVLVDADVNGVTAVFTNVVGQGADTAQNLPLIDVRGNNNVLVFKAPALTEAGAGIYSNSGTGNIVKITDPWTGFFNRFSGASALAFDHGSDPNSRVFIDGESSANQTITMSDEVRWDGGPARIYTPTIANSSGEYADAGGSANYRKAAHSIKVSGVLSITDIGTAAGYTTVTLPFESPGYAKGTWTNFTTGELGHLTILPGSNVATLRKIDNSPTPFSSGNVFMFSAEYEISE
jgi:hypothetical protein